MTPDEAYKIYDNWHDRNYGKELENIIDLLFDLNILKNEDSWISDLRQLKDRSDIDVFDNAEAALFETLGWPKFGGQQTEVQDALRQAGLMIVKRPK
jgi:hypothetical protein